MDTATPCRCNDCGTVGVPQVIANGMPFCNATCLERFWAKIKACRERETVPIPESQTWGGQTVAA